MQGPLRLFHDPVQHETVTPEPRLAGEPCIRGLSQHRLHLGAIRLVITFRLSGLTIRRFGDDQREKDFSAFLRGQRELEAGRGSILSIWHRVPVDRETAVDLIFALVVKAEDVLCPMGGLLQAWFFRH